MISLTEIYKNILWILFSPQVQDTLLPLRVIFIFLSFFFFGFLIFFLLKTKWLRFIFIWDLYEFLFVKPYGALGIARHCRKISQNIERYNLDELKKAILILDKDMDRFLERLNPLYQANNFEERLAYLGKETIENIEDLKKAHQIAKKIKTDKNFSLSSEKAKEILNIYLSSFKSLEIFEPSLSFPERAS